jgi:rhodanese-related sulfurtransferase
MTKVFKLLAASFVAVFAVAGLTGCTTQEPIDMSKFAAVIDVRTPEETSLGYLEGAQLFDIQNPSFMGNLATLDPAADYYIYCRSGNRAGQAIEIMQQSGFTGELVNGGSLENAANQTGLTVVQ